MQISIFYSSTALNKREGFRFTFSGDGIEDFVQRPKQAAPTRCLVELEMRRQVEEEQD